MGFKLETYFSKSTKRSAWGNLIFQLDCGGVWGYIDMAKAMKAKRGSSYREYKEWLGGYYDVNEFDLAEVNEQLAETRQWQ